MSQSQAHSQGLPGEGPSKVGASGRTGLRHSHNVRPRRSGKGHSPKQVHPHMLCPIWGYLQRHRRLHSRPSSKGWVTRPCSCSPSSPASSPSPPTSAASTASSLSKRRRVRLSPSALCLSHVPLAIVECWIRWIEFGNPRNGLSHGWPAFECACTCTSSWWAGRTGAWPRAASPAPSSAPPATPGSPRSTAPPKRVRTQLHHPSASLDCGLALSGRRRLLQRRNRGRLLQGRL